MAGETALATLLRSMSPHLNDGEYVLLMQMQQLQAVLGSVSPCPTRPGSVAT